MHHYRTRVLQVQRCIPEVCAEQTLSACLKQPCALNYLGRPMGSTWFRIPPPLSSVLTVFGMLQLRAIGILNRVDPLVSSSNCYVELGVLVSRKRRLKLLNVIQ